ncbi:MAG: HAD-IIA family hydrolase [Archaeoglobaceae archaeon]|nr:HAD-IIA family hydrolase [Archaeoglobaceae archaeon]MDW8117614.1 HAD-IIA family hydrolase [Archaeoglobaceae archaeon]
MHPLLKKKGYIIDIDGVIGRSVEPIEEGVRGVNKLLSIGKRVVFVSNNSTRSKRILLERLKSFGIEVGEESIVSATQTTARFISKEKEGAKVFTTGEDGLKEELIKAGLKIVDHESAEYLVVGSNRKIDYDLMTKALRCCLRGTRYVATNPDKIFPSENGPTPGTGMIIGALYWMTGRLPDVIVGKPSKVIMLEALEKLNLKADEILVVGDQIEIDVVAGKKIGAETLLVLTGISKKEDVEKADVKPDYVLPSLESLFLK